LKLLIDENQNSIISITSTPDIDKNCTYFDSNRTRLVQTNALPQQYSGSNDGMSLACQTAQPTLAAG